MKQRRREDEDAAVDRYEAMQERRAFEADQEEDEEVQRHFPVCPECHHRHPSSGRCAA
jgi:hypothetical protein